jgi:cytochrome c-type biogenesis protein CcmH
VKCRTGGFWIPSSVLWALLLSAFAVQAGVAPDLDERTREIAAELRCVVCQNLSVADSPSEMAQQMRGVVREQLQAGKSPEEVKEYFVSKYGEWVLLKPKTTGVSAMLWILPYIALVCGIIGALWFIRRWAKRTTRSRGDRRAQAAPSPQLIDDFARRDLTQPGLDDTSPRAELLREAQRLKDELSELEFDYKSGKLSTTDFTGLRDDIQAKGALLMQQLAALPAQSHVANPTRAALPDRPPRRLRAWQLVAGGVFLLLFGLALGAMLTQSLRPRDSENDTMTGDFMTGTTPASPDARAAMSEGKQAFAQQNFPKAIDSFKRALAADPNNPEAHTYMGFILVQAGHSDGALMAFDKALVQAPNMPMALWGKGMVLYQEKKDYTGARQIFERLLNLMPPGDERNEIIKVLAEMPAGATPPLGKADSAKSPTAAKISGTISIDPKLKSAVDPNAALFVIARAVGPASGPPLAVKKIDKPVFPVTYSLGPENVMLQGTPFTGKVNLSVRLDKDGNPVTRAAGDVTGEYRKNPVEVGTAKADIVLDQVAQ